MQRLIKKANTDFIEYLDIQSILNTIEKIDIEEIIKTPLFQEIQRDLKLLKKLQEKRQFMNTAISIYNKVNYLQIKINNLKKIMDKLIKQ